MNTALILMAISLVVLQALGLRTMQKDHLFSIAHRAEMVCWAIFACYLFSAELLKTADISTGQGSLLQISPMIQLLLLVLMVTRIFSCIAFTLGNPPVVSIVPNEQEQSMQLVNAVDTPGVKVDGPGQGHVIL